VLLLIIVGFVVLADLSWRFLEWTSGNAFCARCHEMEGALRSWQGSTHYVNPSGMQVRCIDCHLPPQENILRFTAVKGAEGLKDVAYHVLKRPYDAEEMTERLLAEIPDDRCLKCHPELFSPEMTLEAHIAHTVVLFPEDGHERNCLSCHPQVGHKRPVPSAPAPVDEDEEKTD